MRLDRHALANHLEVRWLIIENVSCLRQVGMRIWDKATNPEKLVKSAFGLAAHVSAANNSR
jgi:hypothetical protein